MADQGSIWLQMVIIATAAILLPLKQQRAVCFTSTCQNCLDALHDQICVAIQVIWSPNKKFCVKLKLLALKSTQLAYSTGESGPNADSLCQGTLAPDTAVSIYRPDS